MMVLVSLWMDSALCVVMGPEHSREVFPGPSWLAGLQGPGKRRWLGQHKSHSGQIWLTFSCNAQTPQRWLLRVKCLVQPSWDLKPAHLRTQAPSSNTPAPRNTHTPFQRGQHPLPSYCVKDDTTTGGEHTAAIQKRSVQELASTGNFSGDWQLFKKLNHLLSPFSLNKLSKWYHTYLDCLNRIQTTLKFIMNLVSRAKIPYRNNINQIWFLHRNDFMMMDYVPHQGSKSQCLKRINRNGQISLPINYCN